MSKLIVYEPVNIVGRFFISVYLNVPSIVTEQTTDFADALASMNLNCGFLNAKFAILKI